MRAIPAHLPGKGRRTADHFELQRRPQHFPDPDDNPDHPHYRPNKKGVQSPKTEQPAQLALQQNPG